MPGPNDPSPETTDNTDHVANIVRGTSVIVSLILTIAASSKVRFGNELRVSFQPKDAAFSIWGLIFFALFVSALTLASNDSSVGNSNVGSVGSDSTTTPPLNAIAALVTGALLLSTVWALIVNANRSWALVGASVALCLAAVCAISATALARVQVRDARSWMIAIGPGLLAGWLSLASVLSVSLALPRPPPDWAAWFYLIPGSAALVAGGVAGNPAPALAILWGSLFSPRTAMAPGITLGLAAIAGAGAALARSTQ